MYDQASPHICHKLISVNKEAKFMIRTPKITKNCISRNTGRRVAKDPSNIEASKYEMTWTTN
jgi:formate-dependent phosphoribosylglycinamide formyltransferase (GAR transformylase)